jgi:ferredoxin
MKFNVDSEVCISCGLCPEIEGDVFRFNDDGKAEAYQDATSENEDNAVNAMESCPVDAITKVDE